MRTRTRAEMVSDVRKRTNMENSEFVTDAEIAEFLNQELAELHSRLVANEGQPHFRSSTTYSVDVGTTLYPLPSDFYKLQRLVGVFGSIERDLSPFMEGERAALSNSAYYSATFIGGPKYRLQGDNLEILPVSSPFTARLFYIQSSPRLDDDADTTDGFNGYEIAAIYGACASVQAKEETDPSFYFSQKDRILRHIDSMAHSRDASHPERVTDVTGDIFMDGRWIP